MSIVNNKGYWEERKSVREGKKVRSVFVRYLGKVLGPIADISLSETLRSEKNGIDEEAAERQAIERLDAEEKVYQAKLANLPSGLKLGPVDPSPIEKVLPDISPEPSLSSSDTQSASGKDAAGTAPAGSDDASGSCS
jgi:hypothetical protein